MSAALRVGSKSLNEVLAALGLTKERTDASAYGWRYLRGAEVVHEGNANTCWEWLLSTKQVQP